MNGAPGRAETIKSEILRAAERRSAALLAEALTEAEKVVSEAEAARRREALLASVVLETARLREDLVEARLDAIRTEAAGRLAAEAGSREAVAGLAAAAISRMEGGAFTVRLAAAVWRAGTGGLQEEIARRAGRAEARIELEEDPSCQGGAIVIGGGGSQYWNNSFSARLARFWPALRCGFAGKNGEGK